MAKKNSKTPGIPRIFTPPGPHDPVGNFCAETGNILANKVLRAFSSALEKRLLGKTTPSPEEQYRRDSYFISLQKQQADLERAQTQQLKAAEQLKLTEWKVAEKELQLGKTKQQSTGISIQRSEMDFHVKTEVITGSLDLAATSGGLVVSDEQQEASQEWQENLAGQVIMILGKKGSGKSSTGAMLGEYMQAVFGTPFYWLGIPAWAQELLPSWVRIVDSLDQCPNDCFVLIDEAGLNFLSLKFADKRNVDLRQQLMLCRQKNQTVVFCAQSSRDIDESIVRQSNCTIIKEPGLNAANSERREIRAHVIKAAQIFKQISKEERQRVACVFDENFEGVIRCSLPSFWSEELSNAYGYLGPSDISGQNGSQRIYHSMPGNKPRLSSANVSDEEILELRRKEHGYERIAKTLGCTVYRVRQCLAGQDPMNEL
ncbi:ATP-binding protein [Chloroflexota bacterium]